VRLLRRQPLVITRCSYLEDQGPALLHELQVTERCHKERLLPIMQDSQHSVLAGWSQMVLHSGPEERLLQLDLHWDDKTAFSMGQRLWRFTVALWPLQCLSDVWAVNWDRLKETSLKSHVSYTSGMCSWLVTHSKSIRSTRGKCSSGSKKPA
jgi:hypothetical protein